MNAAGVLDAGFLAALPGERRLLVAVIAQDAVRHADLSARVALAGHVAVRDAEMADVVLADAGPPVLRLAGRGDDTGSALPTGLSAVQLDAALRAAAAGLRVSLPGDPPRDLAVDEQARPVLTPRELDVLTCLGEGLSNKAVARRLGISAHTVKFHLEAVFIKLGAASRAEAVAKGLRRGLILL